LRTAYEAFGAMGAGAFAERARTELSAVGGEIYLVAPFHWSVQDDVRVHHGLSHSSW
jgi:hypothetical protein